MKAKTSTNAPRTRVRKALPPPSSGTHISNCQFTNLPPDADLVSAAVAIARAAERNAEALCAASSLLKGPDALLRVTN